MAIAKTNIRLRVTISQLEHNMLQSLKRNTNMSDSNAIAAMIFAMCHENPTQAGRISGLKHPTAPHTEY